MNKKQKEEIKKAFAEKKGNTVIVVHDSGMELTIDEYLEEESWLRPEYKKSITNINEY